MAKPKPSKTPQPKSPPPLAPATPDPAEVASAAVALAEPEIIEPPVAPPPQPGKTHVVLPGDKFRPPTELETIASQPPPARDAIRHGTPEQQARALLAEMTAAHADRTRWVKLSDAQRYAVTGAAVAFADCLGENNWDGEKADFLALAKMNLRDGARIVHEKLAAATGFEARATALWEVLSEIHADSRRWQSYGILVRHLAKGAAMALAQVLDRKDWYDKRASFARHLGVDIRTHRAVGANAADA